MESKSINLILFGRFPTERAYGVHAVAVADGYRRLGYKTTIFYPSTSNEKTIYEDPKEYYGNEDVKYQKIEHLDITKYFWYKILTYLFYPFAPIYLQFRKLRNGE